MIEINLIPVLEDNYIFVLHHIHDNKTACIDPALAKPVQKFLDQKGWTLDDIFLTHHHWDHTGGVVELKQKYDCKVHCSAYDESRIDGVDQALKEGDQISLGSSIANVIDTPGHTLGHISFHFPEEKLLFCGDTLFVNGCGRLFEGTPSQMWESVAKLKGLPDDTMVYCAHEYTLSNTEFALSIASDNDLLKERMKKFLILRGQGQPTIPVKLGDEKQTNPFMNVDDFHIRQNLGLPSNEYTDDDVFAEIRKRKDSF